jgi:tRNA(Ile)-lysidine synthetase-like protein
VQISAISSLLSDGNFSYSLGGGISFVAERGICSVRRDSAPIDYNFRIEKGRNVLTGLGAELLVTDTPPDKFSLNIYKKSIQGDLSSAIINGSLSLAPKRDGDTVYFGGMTHKLKKLYNDRGIPPSLRPTIPVLSDESGVLWIPGIGVRDDGVREHARGPIVTLCLGRVDDGSDSVLRWAEKFK